MIKKLIQQISLVILFLPFLSKFLTKLVLCYLTLEDMKREGGVALNFCSLTDYHENAIFR